MLEALKNAPDWVQWMVAICTPIAAFFSRDVWTFIKDTMKARADREDKFIERRVSRVDGEIDRVLKLKDELIVELKNTISEKNLAIRDLLSEVKLCRHEREQFAMSSGEQAAKLAEANANLAHAHAELAERELEIANLRKQIAAMHPRAAIVEEAKGDAKELYKKLESAPKNPPETSSSGGSTKPKNPLYQAENG